MPQSLCQETLGQAAPSTSRRPSASAPTSTAASTPSSMASCPRASAAVLWEALSTDVEARSPDQIMFNENIIAQILCDQGQYKQLSGL